MSKHNRHRKHKNENNNPKNINNITEALNNVDANQLSDLLASFIGVQKSENVASESANQNVNEENSNSIASRDIALLNALKPFLTAQRAEVLEKFIDIYTKKENEKK